MATEAGHHPNRVYLDQSGDFHLHGAKFFNDAEVDISGGLEATVSAPVAGTAAGFKLARGEAALDGSNPTTIASGLATIIAVVVCLKGAVAPGVGTSLLTTVISGTNFDVHAWKVTAANDATLVASAGVESFYWIAIGT